MEEGEGRRATDALDERQLLECYYCIIKDFGLISTTSIFLYIHLQ